jgi:hypothetical protein
MGYAEERIIGAVTMAALKLGAEIDISAVGTEAIFRARLPDRAATLWLKLDGGTEMITDATGEEDFCVTLGEIAQNVCDDIWRAD